MVLRAVPFWRNDLHSAVQPGVDAFGNQATTTAFFPLKSESAYVLPSVPGRENSGALSPTFNSPSAAPAGRPVMAIPSPSNATVPQNSWLIVELLGCEASPGQRSRVESSNANRTMQ